jgi:cytochrome c556
LLIDTPGFDDTNVSDTDILQRIADWLKQSYDDGALLTGIIYLHRISDQRMDGASMKNLRMFRRLCGVDNFRMVKLATTMWEKVSEEEGERRQEQLKKEYWKDMINRGSTVHRISKDPQDAIKLVKSFLGGTTTVLQLQDELNKGRTLGETEAGAAIQEDIEKLRLQYTKDLQEAKEEMRAAQRTRTSSGRIIRYPSC